MIEVTEENFSIEVNEEQNFVEIKYQGVNAELLAQLQAQVDQLELDFEAAISGVDGQLGSLADDIDSLSSITQAQGDALSDEIVLRGLGDTQLGEDLFAMNEALSDAITASTEGWGQAILDEATARGAAIAEANAIIATDVAILTVSVEGMATELGAAQASIIEVDTALSTEVSARSAQYSAIQADFEDTNAAVLEESVARADADTAFAAQITIIEADVASASAAVVAEASARASADSALASSITTLSATVSGNTAAISTEASARATADGVIEAKYTIKIDVNGHIAGYGLIATANNGTPTSEFIVNASYFKVYNGTTALPTFTVSGGSIGMSNVTINGSLLVTGTIVANRFVTDAGVDLAAIVPGALNTIYSSYTSSPQVFSDDGFGTVVAAIAGPTGSIAAAGQIAVIDFDGLWYTPNSAPLAAIGVQMYSSVSGVWADIGDTVTVTPTTIPGSYAVFRSTGFIGATLPTSGTVQFRMYVVTSGFAKYGYIDDVTLNARIVFMK